MGFERASVDLREADSENRELISMKCLINKRSKRAVIAA